MVRALERLKPWNVNFEVPTDSEFSVGENLIHLTDLSGKCDDAWLCLGLPSVGFAPCLRLGPELLYWFPKGVPAGKSVFVASSRLGLELHRHAHWFNAFRTLVTRLDSAQSFLITSTRTTAHRFVERAGALFDLPVVCFSTPCQSGKRSDLEMGEPVSDSLYPGLAFPGPQTKSVDWDRTLIGAAHEVRVLHARSGGKVEQSITARCKNRVSSNAFVLSPSAMRPLVVQRLEQLGCYRWHVVPSDSGILDPRPRLDGQYRIPLVGSLPDGRFLIHCTRPRTGPWPGQSEPEYLDDLIFQNEGADHSAVATLNRIRATGRIEGSSKLTRGPQPVVSFTEIPLGELNRHTVYRSHLARWDFLPIGIAIRRESLEGLGVRRVVYGNDQTWEAMSVDERPYFQKAQTITSRGKVIDWTLEREWRVLGNVELTRLRPGDVFAFDQTTP